MEIALRAALLDWLASDPQLAGDLNAIVEEAPSRTSLPWLAIATSASVDWSTKTHEGREVRIALELSTRGDTPAAADALVARIEARIATVPEAQATFQIVTTQFLRARVQQRSETTRTILLEYRFRVLAD